MLRAELEGDSGMLTIIGAGAVGVTLATYLSAAARPVRLYARPKDVAGFQAAGQLKLDRPRGGLLTAPLPPLTPQLFDADSSGLVIATKFSALESLLPTLRDAAAGLPVITTLNGVQALALLRHELPALPVTALTIMFNAQLDGPLQARLTTKPAVIVSGGNTALYDTLQGTGLAVRRSAGDTAPWGKLLINLANALGALTQSTFRDLQSDAHLRAVFVAVLDEAVDRIEAAQIAYKLPMPLPYRGYRALLKHGGGLTWQLARVANGLDDGAYPSMVSDVRAGRATEVQQLNGEIVRLGTQLDWPAPLNARLVAMVEALDRQAPQRLTPAELRTALSL